MKARDPRWLQHLDRVHGCALRLYPRAFRERWAQSLRQAFRDRCREAARGDASLAAVAFELSTDFAASLAAEHLHQGKEPAMKIVAAVVSAALFAVLCAMSVADGLHWEAVLRLAPSGLALLALARLAWSPVRAAACIVNALLLAGCLASTWNGEFRILFATQTPAMLALFLCFGVLSPVLALAALLRWPRPAGTRHATVA